MMFSKIDEHLRQRHIGYVVLYAFTLVVLLGWGDVASGGEFSFDIFYIIPVALSTWYGNRNVGLATVLLTGVVWFIADQVSGQEYSHALFTLWNSVARLMLLVIILMLLNSIKQRLLCEEQMANTDDLTGIANRRYFFEHLDIEADRAKRYSHSLTLAYLDLDNFKRVNDEHGHAVGDEVLKAVAKCLQRNARHYDVCGRIGGDEFVVLFPEVNHESARHILDHMHTNLLDTMQRNGWAVTFSIGVMTFETPIEDAGEMLHQVDHLMYKVKKSGKNSVVYYQWNGAPPVGAVLNLVK